MSDNLKNEDEIASKDDVRSFFKSCYIISDSTRELEYVKTLRKVFDGLEKRRILPEYKAAVEKAARQTDIQNFLGEVLGVNPPKSLKPEEIEFTREKLENSLKLYYEALNNGTEAKQTELFNTLRRELNTQYETYVEKNGFATREVARSVQTTDATGKEIDVIQREKRSAISSGKVSFIEDTSTLVPSPETMSYFLAARETNSGTEKQNITEEQARAWAKDHGYILVKQTIDNADFIRKKATLVINGTKIRIEGEKQQEMLIALFSAEGKTLIDKHLHLDEFFEDYENEDGALSYSKERAAFKKKCLATMRGLNQKIRKAGFPGDFIQTANDDFFINPDLFPEQ